VGLEGDSRGAGGTEEGNVSGIKPVPLSEFYRSLHARGMDAGKLAALVSRSRVTVTRILSGDRPPGYVWSYLLPHLTRREIGLLREAHRQIDPHRNSLERKAERAKQSASNREKVHARIAVRTAVRQGNLVRPDTCPRCGQPGNIEAHHADYSKPYDVQWLCAECHRKEHSKPVGTLFHVEAQQQTA
jgi:ribosomal protein S27AE